MSRISSIGFKRPIPFRAELVSFAVSAGYVCENRLIRSRISSLSLDQKNLDILLGVKNLARLSLRPHKPSTCVARNCWANRL